MIKYKDGMSQFKTDYPEDYAKYLAEGTAKIKVPFRLSQEGFISEGENDIRNGTEDIKRDTE